MLPSSMQAKEKIYDHISVGKLGVDIEDLGDEEVWLCTSCCNDLSLQPHSHAQLLFFVHQTNGA